MKIQRLTVDALLGHLNEIERKNAPSHLYLAGNSKLLHRGPRIAIVGSRKASPEGLARTRVLTRAFVKRGMIVVSGLAGGVDTVAHETALLEGGHTIAILGTSLQDCHPPQNLSLQQKMMREQLVISQFPPGSPIQRKNFPIRNRTMALLTDATVIIEAGEKSGTLHQGWEALRLGRLLFILESTVKSPRLTWPAELIRYGAQILSRKNFECVLDEMPTLNRRETIAL